MTAMAEEEVFMLTSSTVSSWPRSACRPMDRVRQIIEFPTGRNALLRKPIRFTRAMLHLILQLRFCFPAGGSRRNISRHPAEHRIDLRLGKWLGTGPETWINMQAQYELWKAEQALKRQVMKIPPLKLAA
jgi:hypothetical protein